MWNPEAIKVKVLYDECKCRVQRCFDLYSFLGPCMGKYRYISHRGATQVCVFTGYMESLGYQKILERNLLPFIANTYADGHRL